MYLRHGRSCSAQVHQHPLVLPAVAGRGRAALLCSWSWGGHSSILQRVPDSRREGDHLVVLDSSGWEGVFRSRNGDRLTALVRNRR